MSYDERPYRGVIVASRGARPWLTGSLGPSLLIYALLSPRRPVPPRAAPRRPAPPRAARGLRSYLSIRRFIPIRCFLVIVLMRLSPLSCVLFLIFLFFLFSPRAWIDVIATFQYGGVVLLRGACSCLCGSTARAPVRHALAQDLKNKK